MSSNTENPFRAQPLRREITLTFRVTKPEHDAIVAVAGTKRGAIKDFIRESVAVAIERHKRKSS